MSTNTTSPTHTSGVEDAALVGVLFTPGADDGSQYFVMEKTINVFQGAVAALAICLCGAVVAAALAIPLINSNVAFFQKAESTSFHVALGVLPLTAFSNAVQHQLAGLCRFRILASFSLIQTLANGLAIVCLVVCRWRTLRRLRRKSDHDYRLPSRFAAKCGFDGGAAGMVYARYWSYDTDSSTTSHGLGGVLTYASGSYSSVCSLAEPRSGSLLLPAVS